VCAIRGNNQEPVLRINTLTNKVNVLIAICRHPVFALALLGFIVACHLVVFMDGTAAAASHIRVRSIAQITVDDANNKLQFPIDVFFDPVEENLYVIDGNSNRVIVYNSDFFPWSSIGIGRNIQTPRGVAVMSNGDVYVSQIRAGKNPSPKISILNAAFFVKMQIFLDKIPEVTNFIPRQVAVNNDGIMYLAGKDYRGVLVLNDEGDFLRLLQPITTTRTFRESLPKSY